MRVQEPALTKVRLVPLTVQTPAVVVLSATASPELDVAAKAGVAVPRAWLPGVTKVMVWLACNTMKLRGTMAAAAKVVSPAWLAVTAQLPALTSVTVVPLTEQTLGVVDAKDTASPEVAVALKAGGTTPQVVLAGLAKVMVCAVSGAAATMKDWLTAAAAATLALPEIGRAHV